MRQIRFAAALCAAFLLAACSNDLLPGRPPLGSWTSRVTHGTGGAATLEEDNLWLHPDGAFVWTKILYGDGAGHPDMPIYRMVRFGQHRVRDGYLDIRTDSSHFARPVTAAPQRIVNENPQWSGGMYRIRVMGEVLSLRFTVAPADAPIERTLLFERDEFRPID